MLSAKYSHALVRFLLYEKQHFSYEKMIFRRGEAEKKTMKQLYCITMLSAEQS